MKKIAGLWLGYTALVLLSACGQKASGPMGPEPQTAAKTGEAEIHLPALPQGILAKRAGAADPMFILTVSGHGMVTRKHAWPLSPSKPTSMKVLNIPVGQRSFLGELEVNGVVTHSDSAWAAIQAGKTAQVNLQLKPTSGNAKICVEIEGVPPSPDCLPPRRIPDVSGCWRFSLGGDTLNNSHVLNILQNDTALQGVIRWAGGGADTARGTIQPGGWITFGLGQLFGDWVFSGSVDSLGNTLSGKFFRKNGEPSQVVLITATRGSCVIVAPPIIPVVPAVTCLEVSQSLDSNVQNGQLAYTEKGGKLYGYYLWSGYTAMPITGTMGTVFDAKALYFYGNLPSGLARPDASPDRVHYKGQIPFAGTPLVQHGMIYGVNEMGEAMALRGYWKGFGTLCKGHESAIIKDMHRL